MPTLWQQNPDLANRLTSDWKEGSYNQDNTRQIIAMVTIAAQCGFGLANFTGLGVVLHLFRTLSSLLGYFDSGDTPILRLLRSNLISFVSLVLCMGGLLLGYEVLSTSLLLLMVVNLFDVYCAFSVPPAEQQSQIDTRASMQEQFWLTSWRNNSYNDPQSNNQTMQIFFMFF